MKTNRTETIQRLARLGALYALVLVSAVACGQSYKQLNSVNMDRRSMNRYGHSASLASEIVVMNATGSSNGNSAQLDLSVVDGARAVQLSLRLSGTREVTVTELSGNVQYTAIAACMETTCSQIAVLLSGRGSTTKQNAYLYSINGNEVRPLATLRNMNFTRLDQAYSVLQKESGADPY